MDEKAKEIIAPFSDWDIGGLRFGRVMAAIDAIMESKIERLMNDMKAEIQKLQIEKVFPPKTTNEGEDKDVDEEVHKKIEKGKALGIYAEADEKENIDEKLVEFNFKRSIEVLLTKKYVSELNTLVDSEYYNNAKWFVNLLPYTTAKTSTLTSSFHEYCRAIKRKVDILIYSVNTDSISNAFYISMRSKNTKTLDATWILFNPKSCTINRVQPFEYNKSNDDIRLIITDYNGDKHSFKFKFHQLNSIIDCDSGNPNFMLFDPVNHDYILFYKSHKLLLASCDAQNVKNDDDVDEEVNESKLWGECSHPNDTKEKDLSHLWYSAEVVQEDKRIKNRNKLKEIFGGVIMTITNEHEVNDNFTYSNSDLQTLKKNIRKYIRNLICEISESEPLYIYSNKNKQIDKPITCYRTRNYKIIPSSTTNNPWFDIKVICENCDISIPILFFDKSTYFLSVRNTDPKNKSYNFAIVNTKTKEFVIFTKDRYVYEGWKLEITLDKNWWR